MSVLEEIKSGDVSHQEVMEAVLHEPEEGEMQREAPKSLTATSELQLQLENVNERLTNLYNTLETRGKKVEEPKDAGEIKEEAKEPSSQEEVVEEEEERLRVRELKEDRLETEPGEKAPVEEVREEVKAPEKAEQVKQEVVEEKESPQKSQARESLLASFSGIKGFFDIPKKKGKQEEQRDEMNEWLDMQKTKELESAETDKEIAAIERDYAKKKRDTNKLFSREKYDASQRATEVRRKIVKDFITDNRKDLQRVHGNVAPAMLGRVNAAKSMRDIDKTLDYMDKVMNKQKDKEEGVAWSKEFEKMEKQLSPETYAEKGAKPLKGKKNVTTELLGTLSRREIYDGRRT
jgi:hypothetical protein